MAAECRVILMSGWLGDKYAEHIAAIDRILCLGLH